MKYIVDFLKNDVESSEIYTLLDVGINEAKVLKFLTQSYIDGISSNSVYTVLGAVFGEDGYEYLKHLDEIKNLLDSGYISKNVNIFKTENVKNLKGSKLSLLHAEVELSELFLSILENGIVDTKLPNITEYSDHLEYLQDQFLLVEFYQKRFNSSSLENQAKIDAKISELTDTIRERVKLSKIPITVEQIFKANSLDEREKVIFLALLKEEYSGEYDSLRDTNMLVGMVSRSDIERIKNRALLEEGSNLLTSGLVDYDEVLGTLGGITKSYFINEEILQSIMHPQKNDKKSKKLLVESMVKDSEIFELIEPQTDINDVVLNPKIKEVLDSILKQLDKKVIAKLNNWGIKTRRGIDAKIIFYGPAGTGKTMSAISLAKSLKKQVISFDCSKILSKYVGESEQNVRKIFDTYKMICETSKTQPVLLLNEADQFLSSRLESGANSVEKMHNQMQNIFLEQIENFQGVLIATTNFLQSLDSAFSRRFDFKIEFKKPNYDERLAIWRRVMPESISFESSFSIEELAKFELSGAQIVLVLKNTALKVAVRDDEIFTLKDFEEEIKRELISSFGDDKKVGLL
ncbi:ATP-binding protein [Campylobacter geochelonis]|uniref:Cysteine synthase A n=1 Tax=Campylobacter geochelonis TaxID=1780362 RepID=A0A128EN75_9BACT|nr:ATP-binding protein [Campylobacter geochelonis]QKF70497.1 ATP-binding protein (AAA domain) [Campylobacter geochelonis]CZE46166.1 cysteine synthase A [Campylobacter geochelonis]CZE46466.1 cysteine synthase A [Campylobacter geochelonis]CZE50462.1 cysteine synthase A [Campylobacter geochelonis]